MNPEMEQFQKDLLASVRQMKAGKVARVTEVKLKRYRICRKAKR